MSENGQRRWVRGSVAPGARPSACSTVAKVSTEDLRALPHRLLVSQSPATDTEIVEQLEVLEALKAAACAAQARLTESLVAHRPTSRSGTIPATVVREVGLARQESPHAASNKVRLARALSRDLPGTFTALWSGAINERRAQIIADETRHLDSAKRREADRLISAKLDGLGDRSLTGAIRRIALRLDDAGASARTRRAMAERHLRTRMLGDGTACVSVITSALHAAAITRSIDKAAESVVRGGDELGRTRAQVAADIASERLAGLEEITGSCVPVSVNLVVSAETLLGGADEPAHLAGVGPIPASVARAVVVDSDPFRSTLRRLFSMPGEGTLVAMESAARFHPHELREMVAIRDDRCRTPFCNAPARHIDHVRPAAKGGETSLRNGQGLCAWCNYTKDHVGWRHEVTSADFDPHEVTLTTPTGRQHRSRAPDSVVVTSESPGERQLIRMLFAA